MHHLADGMIGCIWIPQIPAPLATPILMYPSTPQSAPQEFLTRKYSCPFSVPYPTARTPWSREVPQAEEVRTPPVYYWKTVWSASMATETGP